MIASRKAVAMALLALGAGMVGYGLAQTSSSESGSVLISVPCYADALALGAVLHKQYGEIPLGESVSNMSWLNGEGKVKEVFGNAIMFANPETRTYSNVLIFKDGSACVINSGIDFKPATQREYN